MLLPKPGSKPEDIILFADKLVRQSVQDPRYRRWLEDAERALQLFVGDHYAGSVNDVNGRIRLVINRIKAAVISLMAVQASDPPRIKYRLRESARPSKFYLNPAALTHLPAEDQDDLDMPRPLDDDEVEVIKQIIQQGKLDTAAATSEGLPPPAGILKDDALIEVNDARAIEARQTIFEEMWEECGAHFIFNENCLNKNIFGCQPTLYGFNDDLRQHELKNTETTHVFFQPTNANMKTNAYAVYDQPLSAEEAKAKYQQFAGKIDEWSREGQVQFSTHQGYMASSMYQQQFEQNMVVVRTCWIRHQVYPLSPAEALRKGKITVGEVATGEVESAPDMASGAIEQRPIMRHAYLHPDTGEELTKDHPDWPRKFGIRQITILVMGANGEIIEDAQSEFGDIPLPNNVNTPIPFSPLGSGEPTDLEDVQMALNRVISDMITHEAFNSVPPELIDEEVADLIPNAASRRMRSKWGQRIIIPHETAKELNGLANAVTNLQVPPIPPEFWRLLDFLVNMIDKQANLVQVAQGEASAGWSGEAIQSLQRAHNALVTAKSQRTEMYLKHLAELMDHSIMTRLTVEDWQRYLADPPAVVAALYERNRELACQISVEITSGSAAAREAETQSLRAARKEGLSISETTIIERMELDPKMELQKQMQFEREKSELVAQMVGTSPTAATAETASAANNLAEKSPVANNPREQGA